MAVYATSIRSAGHAPAGVETGAKLTLIPDHSMGADHRIRVGSDEYARSNKSYGLTTLKNRHVEVDGTALRFNLKGKSGKVWKL